MVYEPPLRRALAAGGALSDRERPHRTPTNGLPDCRRGFAPPHLLEDEPEQLDRLWERTRFFKRGLRELGFETSASETPITPVITSDEGKAIELARLLWERGVYCPAVIFPTVGRGRARVRTIVTADHTEQDLAEALRGFEQTGRRLGLI
jgi:glycine C-acetyltransferase